MVCLGFIQTPESYLGENITLDFIKDPNAIYQVDIADTKFQASVYTSPKELTFLKPIEITSKATYRPSTVFSVKKKM